MAVTVKATAVNANGSATITLPASIVAGDLILLAIGAYSAAPTLPTGYTQIGTTNGSSATYTDYLMVAYKIAVAGDAGAALTIGGVQASYYGVNAYVLTGHDPTTPIHKNSASATSSGPIPAVTTTVATRRFAFMSEMGNAATPIPVFTTPTGMTNDSTNNASGNYHAVVSYSYNTQESAGTLPAIAMASSQPGAIEGISVAVAVGNQAPTLSNLAPNNAASGVVTSTSRFTWTYSDAESNPQTQYEIGYRIKDSGSAFTTATNTSANAYHDFAANTFTDGAEYEWQLRVNDGVGGWSAYSNAFFTAGPSTWSYGPIVTSSTASGKVPDALYSNDFEASDLTNWESNSVFGVYPTPATYAVTTTRANGGTKALEATWQASNGIVDVHVSSPFIVGKTYVLTADIYVPTGAPDVRLETLFVGASRVSLKDQWVTASVVFTATKTDHFFGVSTEPGQAATAGQKTWIDNFKVFEAPTVPGTYYLQARTSDAGGFGPWSANATFTINPTPTASGINLSPRNVGGNINVTWTYGANGNGSQNNYQIRYRKRS